MPHGGIGFPLLHAVRRPRLVEVGVPRGKLQLAVLDLDQRLEIIGTAVGRQPHDLTAFVPVGENVTRHPAIHCAEPVHAEEFVAEQAAARRKPHLLQGLELGALERVVALGFAGERIDALGELVRLLEVRTVIADAVDHHHHALLERADGKGAIGVREMVRDRHYLVRLRQIKRAVRSDRAVAVGHVALVDQANFQVPDVKHVAIAHHQIDVVERDALGAQTIIDGLHKEPAGMFFPRDALLLDRIGDLAVAQQAGADVVVVGVYAEDVVVIFCHQANLHHVARLLQLSPGCVMAAR